MRPVHVIVTEDSRQADAWSAAYGGNIELYRFGSNAEVFERLIGATSPVHLLVITPSQNPMFNLKTAELVRRLVNSPVGALPALAGLGIVVIGDAVEESARVVACSTIESAIRFVTFGEREPQDAVVGFAAEQYQDSPGVMPQAEWQTTDSAAEISAEVPFPPAQGGSGFVDSLIDSLWTAPNSSGGQSDCRSSSASPLNGEFSGGGPHRGHANEVRGQGAQGGRGQDGRNQGGRSQGGRGQEPDPRDHPNAGTSTGARVRMPRTAARFGRGNAPVGAQRAALFAQSRAAEVAQANASPIAGNPIRNSGSGQAGPASVSIDPPAYAHSQSMDLRASGDDPLLLPARKIMLQRRGVQNDGTRGGHPAARHVVRSGRSAPLPGNPRAQVPSVPAVAGQVAQLVYGGSASADPVLGWSAKIQDELASQRQLMASPVQHLSAQHPAPHVQPVQALQLSHPVPATHLASPGHNGMSASAGRPLPAAPLIATHPHSQMPVRAAMPGPAAVPTQIAAPLNDNFAAPAALLQREQAEGVSFG